MAVYDEEHVNIDISKGLWLSPTPDSIPEGYCPVLKNFIKTERGTWKLHNGIAAIWTQAVSAINITTSKVYTASCIPEDQYGYFYDYSTAGEGPNFANVAGNVSRPEVLFTYRHLTSGFGRIKHVTGRKAIGDSLFTNDQQVVQVHHTFTQYKDRIYGGGHATAQRLTGYTYDGSVPNITVNAITGSIANDYYNYTQDKAIMTSYENRLWYGIGSRVWYTDIPAAGGYPETFGAANFFDLPVDQVGSSSVKAMKHLNGILYIFTDRGIFALNGKGSTSNWTLSFVTDAIRLVSEGGVAVVNGSFIATDRKNLFLFTGTSIQKIGQEIQYAFDVYNSFTICPFEKGFVLACRFFAASGGFWVPSTPTGADATDWPLCRSFYFDGSVWSEMVWSQSGSLVDPIFGAVGKQIVDGKSENISMLGIYDHTGAQYALDYYSETPLTSVTGTIRTKEILGKSTDSYIFSKKVVIKVFSLINGVLTAKIRKQGSSTAVSENKTVTNQADNNYTLECVGAEKCNRFNVELVAVFTSTPFNTNYPDSIPPFEIKSIISVQDSDMRDMTESVQV